MFTWQNAYRIGIANMRFWYKNACVFWYHEATRLVMITIKSMCLRDSVRAKTEFGFLLFVASFRVALLWVYFSRVPWTSKMKVEIEPV